MKRSLFSDPITGLLPFFSLQYALEKKKNTSREETGKSSIWEQLATRTLVLCKTFL